MTKKNYSYLFGEIVPESTNKLMNTDLCCTTTKHHHTVRTVTVFYSWTPLSVWFTRWPCLYILWQDINWRFIHVRYHLRFSVNYQFKSIVSVPFSWIMKPKMLTLVNSSATLTTCSLLAVIFLFHKQASSEEFQRGAIISVYKCMLLWEGHWS
jgi:hypothetical protein